MLQEEGDIEAISHLERVAKHFHIFKEKETEQYSVSLSAPQYNLKNLTLSKDTN